MYRQMRLEYVVFLTAAPLLSLVFYLDWLALTAKIEVVRNPARWSRLAVKGANLELATFGLGGSWEGQRVFDVVSGVAETMVGYTGGLVRHPTYTEAGKGTNPHTEAVRVLYNSSVVPYATLLNIFWANVDPTNPNGQFCHQGPSYAPAVFYHTDEQKNLAVAWRARVSSIFNSSIRAKIRPASTFFPAEEEHQFLYLKNPEKFQEMVRQCNRSGTLKNIWTPERLKLLKDLTVS